jgi:hypothetical protein
MPEWAQWFSFVNPCIILSMPCAPFFVRERNFQSVSIIAGLGVYALVLGLWAVASYRKNSR